MPRLETVIIMFIIIVNQKNGVRKLLVLNVIYICILGMYSTFLYVPASNLFLLRSMVLFVNVTTIVLW